MKNPGILYDIAVNMEKVRDGGQALAIRNSGVNLLNVSDRTVISYDGSKLNFVENAIYLNMARNGVYTYTQTTYDISDPKRLKLQTNTNAFGLNFSFKVQPNETYVLNCSNFDNTLHRMGVGYFTKDCTLISHSAIGEWPYLTVPVTLTTPADCYWMLIIVAACPNTVGTELTFENVKLEFVSTHITDTLVDRGHCLMSDMNEILSDMNDIYQAGQASAAELKTSVSGAAIGVNNVHPVEHNVDVGLKSKNLFDISKVVSTNSILTNNGDGTLSVLKYGTSCSSPNKLKDYCPTLKVGDVVTLSGNSTALLTVGTYTESMARFDLYEAGIIWRFGETKTVTQAMLDSQVIWFCSKTDGVVSEATVSNIQIEEGSTATEYTPYIVDFTNVNPGKNLFDETINKGLGLTGSGNNRTVYADSTAGYKILKVEPNTTYCISGDYSIVADGNVRIASFTDYPAANSISNLYAYGTGNVTITTTATDNYLFLWFILSSSAILTDVPIQIEKGSTATEYAPYQEPVAAEISRHGKNLFKPEFRSSDTAVNYTDGVLFVPQYGGNTYVCESAPLYIPQNTWLYYKHILLLGKDRLIIRLFNSKGENISTGTLTDIECSSAWYLGVYSGYVVDTPAKGFSFKVTSEVAYITLGYCGMNSEGGNKYGDLQLELGTTATEYEPYKKSMTYTANTDGSVDRIRYGKNLLNYSISELSEGNAAKSYYENGTLYVETGSGNSKGVFSNKIYLPTNTPLCYKHKVLDTAGDRVVISCYDENNNNISANINIGWGSYLAYYEGYFGTAANGANFMLPSQVSYVVLVHCRMNNLDKTFNEYSELQIEIGSTATSYEPYQEPVTEGVKSLSPSMTLVSNNPGVIIDATYFKQK